MGAPIVVPFNNQPVSTQKGTGTYTCPAEKYARVTVTVSGRAAVASITGANAMVDTVISSGQFNETMDIWVGPGDTVSGSLSNASGGPSGNASFSGAVAGSSTTTATVNHNGAAIGQFRCDVSAAYNDNSGSVATAINFTGASSFHFFAQEYNVIS